MVLMVFLKFENLSAHFNRDLARQVARGHRGGHFRDVADLVGEVAGHGVHRIGEILPGPATPFTTA